MPNEYQKPLCACRDSTGRVTVLLGAGEGWAWSTL